MKKIVLKPTNVTSDSNTREHTFEVTVGKLNTEIVYSKGGFRQPNEKLDALIEAGLVNIDFSELEKEVKKRDDNFDAIIKEQRRQQKLQAYEKAWFNHVKFTGDVKFIPCTFEQFENDYSGGWAYLEYKGIKLSLYKTTVGGTSWRRGNTVRYQLSCDYKVLDRDRYYAKVETAVSKFKTIVDDYFRVNENVKLRKQKEKNLNDSALKAFSNLFPVPTFSYDKKVKGRYNNYYEVTEFYMEVAQRTISIDCSSYRKLVEGENVTFSIGGIKNLTAEQFKTIYEVL